MLLVCAPLLLLLSCRRDFLGDANSNNLIRVSESLEDEGKSHIKEEKGQSTFKTFGRLDARERRRRRPFFSRTDYQQVKCFGHVRTPKVHVYLFFLRVSPSFVCVCVCVRETHGEEEKCFDMTSASLCMFDNFFFFFFMRVFDSIVSLIVVVIFFFFFSSTLLGGFLLLLLPDCTPCRRLRR